MKRILWCSLTSLTILLAIHGSTNAQDPAPELNGSWVVVGLVDQEAWGIAEWDGGEGTFTVDGTASPVELLDGTFPNYRIEWVYGENRAQMEVVLISPNRGVLFIGDAVADLWRLGPIPEALQGMWNAEGERSLVVTSDQLLELLDAEAVWTHAWAVVEPLYSHALVAVSEHGPAIVHLVDRGDGLLTRVNRDEVESENFQVVPLGTAPEICVEVVNLLTRCQAELCIDVDEAHEVCPLSAPEPTECDLVADHELAYGALLATLSCQELAQILLEFRTSLGRSIAEPIGDALRILSGH